MGKQGPLVLHGEAKDIPVGDGVLDHIAVQAGVPLGAVRHQTGIEHIGGGSAIGALVRLKDRGPGETDVIGLPEVAVDIAVHLPELAAMALIDDENDFLIPVGVHQGLVALRLHRIRHFLDRRDNQLAVGILQLLHQDKSAVGVIHTVLLKGIVLIHRLIVEVLPVDEEDDFIDPRLVPQELGQLEGGQGLAGSGAGKDVAVLIGFQNAAAGSLHGIDLVRAHDHQDRLGGLDDHELVYHFCDGGFPEELRGKLFQGVDALILLIGPEEHEGLQDRIIEAVRHLVLIAEILRLDGIGDNEQLEIAEEALEGELPIAVDLVDGFVDFHTGALQLDLNEGKAVDQHRHIVPVLINDIILMVGIHRDLVGNLVNVPVCIEREEVQIDRLPVVQAQDILVPQELRGLIDRMVVQMDQDTVPFRITERRDAFGLHQLGRIELGQTGSGIRKHIMIIPQVDILIADGLKAVDKLCLDIIFRNVRHIIALTICKRNLFLLFYHS